MGYSECRRFASWSHPFSMFTEAGVSFLRLDLESFDAAMRAAGADLAGQRDRRHLAQRHRRSAGSTSVTSSTSAASPPRREMTAQSRIPFAITPPMGTSGFIIQDAMFIGVRAHPAPSSSAASTPPPSPGQALPGPGAPPPPPPPPRGAPFCKGARKGGVWGPPAPPRGGGGGGHARRAPPPPPRGLGRALPPSARPPGRAGSTGLGGAG